MQALPRILIAESDESHCNLLMDYLGEIRCDIATARDGKNTLEKVASFKPELILLNLKLPELSGLEVCRKVKDGRDTCHTLILMISALDDLDDVERVVKAGADDFVSKPVERDGFIKRVQLMLRLRNL